MKFTPMQDYMILRLMEDTKSRIALPDSFEKEKSGQAILEIIAIGPGYWEMGEFVKTMLKVGNKVIVTGYAVARFELHENKVILARERDVIMTVEE